MSTSEWNASASNGLNAQPFDPSLALRILRAAILLSVPQLGGYGLVYHFYGAYRAALVFYAWAVLSLFGGIFLMVRPGAYRIAMLIECLLILVVNSYVVVLLGGMDRSSGQFLWTIMAPVGTLVIFGPRAGIAAFLGFAIALGAVAFAGSSGASLTLLPAQVQRVMLLMNTLLPTTFVFGVLCVYEWRKRELFELFRQEHDRAEELLVQMLPEHVAERLKREGGPIADSFADVTVMFADISGFTELTPDLSPADLVAFLNAVFSQFDEITEKHGLEKIKTIGDAYMVVGGLSPEQTDHAERMADASLEMMQLCDTHRFTRIGAPLRLRIGLHTGPVIGGVIGQKRFIYDLWGDTVNLASRMQSRGVSGRIQVSQLTYRRLRRTYDFEEAPTVQLTGSREEQAFYLVGRRRPS